MQLKYFNVLPKILIALNSGVATPYEVNQIKRKNHEIDFSDQMHVKSQFCKSSVSNHTQQAKQA